MIIEMGFEDHPERDHIFEFIVDSSIRGIAFADLDGRIQGVNQAFLDMWGYEDESQVLHRSVLEFWHDEKQAEKALEAIREAGEWEGEMEAVRRDGSRFEAEGAANVVPDDDGSPIGMMATFTDVTERKRYERRLEEANRKLEALNRLVRHDIRNDMNVLLGWLTLLEDHVDEDGEEYLHKMQRTGNHIVELTEITAEYVETLTSEAEMDVQPIALKPLLQTEVEIRSELYPNAVFSVQGEIPDVSVRANELLSSVFRNILNNAVQHNDADVPRAEISVEDLEGVIRVGIADNGPGIPDGQKHRVFGKGESGVDSPGTGIGLSLVNTLISQYDGEVWVEDNEPRGAKFVVELPKASG
ncbi:MAG: ATP-binding protein [Halobacteriaceae archaeon]